MKYLLFSVKHSRGNGPAYFWRPDSAGYTDDIDQAGRYDGDEALKIVGDGETTLMILESVLDRFNITPRSIDMRDVSNVQTLKALGLPQF